MDLRQHYKTDHVATASPARLVTMLYDRALQGVEVARLGLGRGDALGREQANRELLHVQRVLTELQVSLDFDRGGEIATGLDALYRWCIDQLVAANVRKDPAPLDSVEATLRGLRDTWASATAELQTV